VREIGYTRVEVAGLGAYSAQRYRATLADAGLTPIAAHWPIDDLESDINSVITSAEALGVRHVVCPYVPEERRADEADWRACAASLNAAGRACRERGLQLSYHNHSFEFVNIGGRFALDLLFAETDPEYVHAELDTYWVKHGGQDPVAYIRKLRGRCPLVHLKDMADDPSRTFAPVGTGTLDFPAILREAETAGCSYGIVEQDTCAGDPLDAVRISFEYLRDRCA
jgi:sugar phosphate isomerase/epimerase